MGSCLHRSPVEEIEWGSFTGNFERKRKFTPGLIFLGPRGH